MSVALEETAWTRGRLDRRAGPTKVLFGRMYEDAAIELEAFRPGGRVFCIASAGDTAMALAREHEVVAVDVNAAQLARAARRMAGEPPEPGAAERLMSAGRKLLPLAGWSRARLRAFLHLDRPEEQVAFWRRQLDTRRFRAALNVLTLPPLLRTVYARELLDCLPPRFGAVLRARMERCFAMHANRTNPYARALLLGELGGEEPTREAGKIELVHADAATYLEQVPGGSFEGLTLSNILDGASASYRERLFEAVRHAAGPDAVVVLRSFGEPAGVLPTNRAAEDRAMLWGIVDVRPLDSLRDATRTAES